LYLLQDEAESVVRSYALLVQRFTGFHDAYWWCDLLPGFNTVWDRGM